MASSEESGAGLADALCAVLDVGKTHVKLVVIDAGGAVVAEQRRPNAAVRASHGYAALDTAGIADWLCSALAGLGPLRVRLARIIATTHGAAFAALRGDALALPVPDYEFDGFDADDPAWQPQLDPFDATLSPLLPHGLNAATQLDWLARHLPGPFASADTLLPYPQFWAWWLSGMRASELSSLGCHTQLWRPREARYSDLAQRRGWAARMAPLRAASDVLGPLRPALASRLGLPADVQVHAGAHDSNACLARFQGGAAGSCADAAAGADVGAIAGAVPGAMTGAVPGAMTGAVAGAMGGAVAGAVAGDNTGTASTLVSTGTWVVVMAPGGSTAQLAGTPDLLANVSVGGAVVPTGRFMGGRELLTLCAGADPAAAAVAELPGLFAAGVMALPGFAPQGGPFQGRTGHVVVGAAVIAPAALPPPQRATLAALYTAQMTAWLVDRLQPAATDGAAAPLVVEGPFAASPVFLQVLSALLPRRLVQVCDDALDGTAGGAWRLACGPRPGSAAASTLRTIAAGPLADAIRRHHARWLQRLDAPQPAAAAAP